MRTLRIMIVAILLLSCVTWIAAQQRPDSEILADLLKRIQTDTGIVAEIKGGVVTLTGTEPSLARKLNVINTARRTPGVREVVDKIRVVPPIVRSDQEIQAAVRRSLDGNLSKEEISAVNIAVRRGVVTLTGKLPSSYPKQVAGMLASWTQGVVDVHNQIAVQPSELRSDLNISTEISRRFQKNPFISHQKIDVTVANGIVTLMGVVDNDLTADQAESIARFTPGVVDVRNLIFVRASGR